MKTHSIVIISIAILLITYTIIKYQFKSGSIVYILLGVALLFLSGCTPKSKKKLVKEYVAKTYQDTSVSTVVVNTNFTVSRNQLDTIPIYSGYYTPESFELRQKNVKFHASFENGTIRVVYDEYLIIKALSDLEKKIKNTINNVTFYVSFTNKTTNPDFSGLDNNTKVEDLRTRFFSSKYPPMEIRISVATEDFNENRDKYLQFHVDFMKALKNNHIEKAYLDFDFYNPKSNEKYEKWFSIHDNTFYELVKNNPTEVLKYGKIEK